jgi:iron complex transport system ATP-binding protein
MTLELIHAGFKIERRWLARAASFRLAAGSFTTFVGPNGSGKSTILRLLAGLWQPSEGKVLLNGGNLSSLSRRETAKQIAYTPQDTHYEFAFTVRDVVMMGRHPHLGRFEREKASDRKAVEEAMERTDCLKFADRFVNELSGGERQRVILARSLATEADVILLDEPLASLDLSHSFDVLDICRDLAQTGKTIALAIHDLNLAARYASNVILISNGRVVSVGTPGEVLTDDLIEEVFAVSTKRAATASGETMLFFAARNEQSKDANH